ncbi:unnamed protein product [Lactuca saligna]|uniref:Uncharacterized protein n=1 Tax=Lactuca saligna TaxID=75948 RepID=A0AA35ZLK6_LACSI|nr:unnamed protein product [Lactuca saligna]
MIRRITNQGAQTVVNSNKIMNIGATTKVTVVCLCRPGGEHDRTIEHIVSFQKDITAARAEVKEFRKSQAKMERHIIEAERQIAQASKTKYHGPQRTTYSE